MQVSIVGLQSCGLSVMFGVLLLHVVDLVLNCRPLDLEPKGCCTRLKCVLSSLPVVPALPYYFGSGVPAR